VQQPSACDIRMRTLAWIIASGVVGGVISVAMAALVAFQARAAAIPMLVSYSVGALLGAVFLNVLPEAFEKVTSPTTVGVSILAGLMFFFILEKLVLWRHHHAPQWGEDARPSSEWDSHSDHGHSHSRGGTMIMIGDTFHNFVDGVLIAAAFLADFHLGLVTALAILAHEVPSEVGDFIVLLHSGYSRSLALLANLASGAAMILGGVAGYFALQSMRAWIPALLGFVAASMIYVAVADLIPGLHRRFDLRTTLEQVVLIGLGIGTIAIVGALIEHSH
jgi:zinc and cadmium transporter